MKALVFELILLLACLQDMGETIYNIISECNPENNCEKCWDDEGMTCYSCKEGYIFGFKSSLTCYKPANIRDIKGYGRSCVECGLGNYADANENYKCKPCPFKCKTCEFVIDGPKCIDCKPAIGETDGYVLNEDCSCTFGDEKNNKGCYCNNENKFIDSSDGSQYCKECTTCDRRQKNCKVLEIPCKEHEFDPLSVNPSLIDDLEADICCQKCDETCETCVGKTQEDCIECRNHDLYEMVGNECLCVCDAAWIDNGDGSHTCKCMFGTEKTDTCPDESCDAKTRYQCRCPAGTQKGEVNADGYSECVAQ